MSAVSVFTLAHLSDLHLGPLPAGAAHRHFALKRAIGVINWRLTRQRVHSPAVALAIAANIVRTAPDHVALTGDIVNVAAPAEFAAAERWMKAFGGADWISFVPGNHDCYVRMAWTHGLSHLEPYMRGDMRVNLTQTTPQIMTPFPYVRLRRNVALIGLSTGVPQPLHRAAGELGGTQLKSLAQLLHDLRERGYARVVMIHHPPLPGLAQPRRALIDASLLRAVLEEHGAELVLHGHNHKHMTNSFLSRFGMVHVLGAPSASVARDRRQPPAAWNLCRIQRQAGKWQIDVSVRGYDPASREVVPLREFALPY
ncbi:metallophosphoesterase [Aestuariivirga sp.]|uniref:metallophosphoesterase family protein n=1 Tax=Aestuariivirga sp. TaxID=2650926 RepID=UPI0025BE39C2|nr:metallophosphoesterase [Aestuariivirga sp.]MCA3555073.1 metallophosphoesterase [Aestuariivirga sp.]